jgi:hypothetical protein
MIKVLTVFISILIFLQSPYLRAKESQGNTSGIVTPVPSAELIQVSTSEKNQNQTGEAEIVVHTQNSSQNNFPETPKGPSVPKDISEIKIIPHRAEYIVEADPKSLQKSNSDVADIKGTMTLQISEMDDGLALEQRSEVQVYYSDGSMEQSITTIASWESHDGQNYRFNIRTLRNGVEEITQGYAMSSPGLIGYVTFEEPSEQRMDLPIGTIFPLTHLKQIILNALNNSHALPNRAIFDGSNETHEVVDVNVFIGGPHNPKINLGSNPELLKVDKAWALQYAVFPFGSRTTEPDFEMEQILLPSGIISSMMMDLAQTGVSTKLTLSKVDILH